MTGPVLRDQQKLVLVGVRLNGGNATAYEVTLALARAAGPIQQSVASKRLGELVERGMVRLTGTTRPGISQRRQRVYEVTPAGRAYLAGRSTQ
jgi:DNA-binding PadR family transcriptional regulator